MTTTLPPLARAARTWLEHYRPKGGKDGGDDDFRQPRFSDGITSVEFSVPGHEPGRITDRQWDRAMDRIAGGAQTEAKEADGA